MYTASSWMLYLVFVSTPNATHLIETSSEAECHAAVEFTQFLVDIRRVWRYEPLDEPAIHFACFPEGTESNEYEEDK